MTLHVVTRSNIAQSLQNKTCLSHNNVWSKAHTLQPILSNETNDFFVKSNIQYDCAFH